ncbi:unnamed protein product [Clavelina lepadiformis]|uniref:Uncharacterized protein n=1 Tax=Clavelina lepadiformis TaxID=159417 RepID=A0ABP0FQI3_CLALP
MIVAKSAVYIAHLQQFHDLLTCQVPNENLQYDQYKQYLQNMLHLEFPSIMQLYYHLQLFIHLFITSLNNCCFFMLTFVITSSLCYIGIANFFLPSGGGVQRSVWYL